MAEYLGSEEHYLQARLANRIASDNPSQEVSGRAPRHHCVGNAWASDQADQALGGVCCFRFFSLLGGTGQGGACHRHRSSQRFSALWRHLPGQECAEVCRALTAIVRAGLEEGVKPMVWIETPQQDGLDHTKHHRSQVGAPHAARAIIVLTAYHWD